MSILLAIAIYTLFGYVVALAVWDETGSGGHGAFCGTLWPLFLLIMFGIMINNIMGGNRA